jgi:serine/threonine-protein kinase
MNSEPQDRTEQMIAGRYRVESTLGSGAMGVVYLAMDEILGRRIALKIMSPEWSGNPAVLARFQAEAKALAQVKSHHVVQIYDFGTFEKSCFFAMEYVRGQALDEIIHEHGDHGSVVPLHRALTILARVADGIAAVHAVGLAHRDVKPANIVIEDDTGRAVLVDFGLASADHRVTQSVEGTPAYMAPEQLVEGGVVTPQSDVYALGITAFELLTGRLPFLAHRLESMFAMHLTALPPKLSSVRPELASLDAIVDRALAKDPTRRYPTAPDLAAALGAAAFPATRTLTRAASLPVLGVPMLRVLIVDDDDDFRTFVSRAVGVALHRKVVHVDSAASGPEALDIAASAMPGLVLLDYDMPQLDGVDTLSRLRSLPGGDHARVVVLSTVPGLMVSRWRFSILGVKDFVSKPVGLGALVALIGTIAEKAGWTVEA